MDYKCVLYIRVPYNISQNNWTRTEQDQRSRMKGGPVYQVKPKNIFRHPFNKFDLDKTTNRDTTNDDLTDYFNYGFN